MSKSETKKLCPYFWTQLSVEPNGHLRVCCYGNSGKDLRDEKGQFLKVDDFKNVEEAFNHPAYRKLRSELYNEGKWPSFCQACLNIEESGGSSPRIVASPFFKEPFEKAIETMEEDGRVDAKLHTLELTLGNICNLRCRMCSPYFSYLMKEEFDKVGLKYNREEVEDIHQYWNQRDELQPLIEDALLQISQVLFLGGEPLISKYHEQVLRYLVDHKRAAQVSLRYNTNLTIVSDSLLELWGHFKQVNLDISLDGVPEVNDFIRKGSSFAKIEENMDRVKERLKEKVTFNVCTVLQVDNFHRMNDWLQFLKTWRSFIPRIPYTIYLDLPYYLSSKTIPPAQRLPVIEQLRKSMDEVTDQLSVVEKQNEAILRSILKDLEKGEWDQEGLMSYQVFQHKLNKAKE